MVLSLPKTGHAQSKLYLDLRAGINHNSAEGAYFGKGEAPFKAHSKLSFGVQGVGMLRLQLSEKLGLATGYSGSELGWAYSIELPKQYRPSPPYVGWRGAGKGVYMHQFPLLVSKTIKEYNIKEIDTVRHTYLASFRLDAVFGGGLNRIGNNCLDCGGLSGGGGLYDEIEFRETIIVRRQWGQFLVGGVTARFYRRGKERLTLSVYYTQGLTDMLLVPVEYRYGPQRGATTLHVRGSGVSATLGYPLRLATFGRATPPGGPRR
ncbi:hypothetical protein BEN47_00225 [Hymenobacter lapidarius]|uniref:Outer membrane protein beta-barrel domain-containing protein n=1 Tax=Hymenobacter lapidarius TaxID=1908237 RepID=A0A1G1T9U7_9BACT|nr:hypothetical protein [Hymenobacter lapidarius]OGX87635.1 hypothetical protein BEN47_00225 [Hymenobacter lapidarius]